MQEPPNTPTVTPLSSRSSSSPSHPPSSPSLVTLRLRLRTSVLAGVLWTTWTFDELRLISLAATAACAGDTARGDKLSSAKATAAPKRGLTDCSIYFLPRHWQGLPRRCVLGGA